MTYISTYEIEQALDTHLKSITSLPKFYAENTFAEQKGKDAFCMATLLPAKTTMLSTGSVGWKEQTGLYQVSLFYPRQYGYKAARQMADTIINIFQTGFLPVDLVSGNKLIIQTAWSQPILDDQNAFIMLPVIVDWIIRA